MVVGVSLDLGGDSFLLTVGASMVVVLDAGIGCCFSGSFTFVRLALPGVSIISVSAPPGVIIRDALCSRSILTSPRSFSSELLGGRGTLEGLISVLDIFV